MLKILQNLETVTVCELLIWPTPWIKEHRNKMISFFLQLTVVSYRNIRIWSQGCNLEVGTESKTVNSTYWFVSSVFLSNTVILHLPQPSRIIHLSRKWHHSLACSPVWLKYFFSNWDSSFLGIPSFQFSDKNFTHLQMYKMWLSLYHSPLCECSCVYST